MLSDSQDFVTIVANLFLIISKFDIDLENCSLSKAKSNAPFNKYLEPAHVVTPSLYLPGYKTLKAIGPPWPILPKTLSTGTLQFSKNKVQVEDPFIPNFFSSAPTTNPSYPFSTINAVYFPLTLANVTATSAHAPFVT